MTIGPYFQVSEQQGFGGEGESDYEPLGEFTALEDAIAAVVRSKGRGKLYLDAMERLPNKFAWGSPIWTGYPADMIAGTGWRIPRKPMGVQISNNLALEFQA